MIDTSKLKKKPNVIGAPIPGQSLTTTPGQRPYEQPPQFNTPDEALMDVLPRIFDVKTAKQMAKAMEAGVSAESFTDMFMQSLFTEGKVSVDTSILMGLPMFFAICEAVEMVGGEPYIKSLDTSNPDSEFLKSMTGSTGKGADPEKKASVENAMNMSDEDLLKLVEEYQEESGEGVEEEGSDTDMEEGDVPDTNASFMAPPSGIKGEEAPVEGVM